MCPVRKRLSIDLNSEQSEPDPLLLTMHCYAKHREDNISAVHPQERKEILLGFLLSSLDSHEGARHPDLLISGQEFDLPPSYLGPVIKVPVTYFF